MNDKPLDTTAVVVSQQADVSVKDFMPLMSVQDAIARKGQINQFITGVMKEGEDYGTIPGGQQKKVLLKPGAEKLCSIFGMAPTYTPSNIVEDWTGELHGGEPLFSYEYRCQLSRGNRFMGEAIGSCNSWESKYRYRWVNEEVAKQRSDFERLVKRGGRQTLFAYEFAIDKAETTGPYGKPAEYWQAFREAAQSGAAKRVEKPTQKGKKMWGWEMEVDTTLYRIPNPDCADIVNTCQKMAQKRALVSAVLVVTNCSDAFTPDLEDFEEHHVQTGPPPDEPELVSKPTSPQAAEGGRSGPVDTKTSVPPAASAPVQQPLPVVPVDERPVPEELQIMVEAIRREPNKELKKGYELLWNVFQKRGVSAMMRYEEMNKAFRNRTPRGSVQTVGQHVSHILDLWDALQKFPEPEVSSGTPA